MTVKIQTIVIGDVKSRTLLSFFVNSNVSSQSSVRQGQKRGVQGSDITVGDQILHLFAKLIAFTQARVFIFEAKVRGDLQKTGRFAICFPYCRRPNRCGKLSVLCQPFLSMVLYLVS